MEGFRQAPPAVSLMAHRIVFRNIVGYTEEGVDSEGLCGWRLNSQQNAISTSSKTSLTNTSTVNRNFHV